MTKVLGRVVRFYAGWRLPFVSIALVLLYVGLATDQWWSPLLALSGVFPLLTLYALTGTRVGAQEAKMIDLANRIDTNETRHVHAEERDASFESQLDRIRKRLEHMSASVKNAVAVNELAHAKREATVSPANPAVVSGQVMALYNAMTGSAVAGTAPLVTVVVPCFNESRFIGDAIRSLKAQTFANFTAIIVDDASTDDSVATAFRAIDGDRRFHVVRHAINSGLSAGRNTGLRLADTPYVCFLDADDFFHVDNLEERLRYLIGQHDEPEVVGVYSGIEHVDEHVAFGEVGPSLPAPHRSDFHDHLSAAGNCPFNCHAPLLRTEVLQRFGGFDETMLHGAEDWECWQRLLRHGYVFTATPHILAVYRQKASSMVRSMPGQHLAEANRLLGSVHQPIDPETVVPNTPFVFSESLGHYQHELQVAERALQFMGMAYLTDNEAQLEAAFDQVNPRILPVADRHFRVSALLDAGIRRGYALDPEGFRHLDGKIAPVREELQARLARHAETVAPSAEPVDAPPLDVVFLPANSSQAVAMVKVANELASQLSVGFVDVTMATGASGVPEVLDSAWSGERFSLNRWVLSGRATRALVSAWPYGPTVGDLIESSKTAGSVTIELVTDPPDVIRLEESSSPESSATASTAADIRGLLGDSDPEPVSAGSDVRLAALAAIEEYPKLPADIVDLAEFRNRHEGERCVIIGNGPSLNDLDLKRLRNENTIGVNGIFYAESIDFPLTYYVVEDTSVMNENLEAIKGYGAGHKFFPTIYRKLYSEVPVEEGSLGGVTFFTMNRGFYAKESPNFCVPRFSTDASQRLYCGQSVTIINLQLAYYLGFSEVYLIGMDFSYTIPDSAKVEGDLITSTEDDPNHFHKDYFGKGKTWKDPKLPRVLNNYQLAKVMFEADGRAIYNATAGGKLELFERRDFHEVFSG